MNTAIWIVQGIVAVMFLMAGLLKSTQPKNKLEPKLPWVKDFSLGTIRLIGLSELLGGIGVLVPWLTGLYPILTPIAASGLGLIMLSAAAYHLRKKEFGAIMFNIILLALTVAIAVYRF